MTVDPIGRRRALAELAGLGLLGLGLAGCSGGVPVSPAPADPSASPTPTPTGSATPTATPTQDVRPRWPLTGVLMGAADAGRHPAVAVKVPDNQWEHPQRGLNDADLVFVELEGYLDGAGYSSTRLVPLFHSHVPADVAPVRSIRPVDVPLLSPADAVIGNTGGSAWVINYVKANRAHLEGTLSYLNTVGTGSYGTDRSRVYYQNGQAYYDRATVCHPRILARQTDRFGSGPPQPYFPFATGSTAASTASGSPARSVSVPYKGSGYAMSYRYDTGSRRYLRSMPWGPHVLADGSRVTTDNIMIIKAHQHFGKIFRGGGHAEPLLDIIDASGPFTYVHGGRSVSGTWRKAGVAAPFTFALADGSPMAMAPGRTFVELPDLTAPVAVGA